MEHQVKRVVTYELYDNSSMYPTVMKTLIGQMINEMPIEEVEKIFTIKVLDPRTAEHAAEVQHTSMKLQNKLKKMHFDQQVEYTISISTATGKKLDREDIEAEGWKCIDIENFDGSSRFTMMGKDQRNPPLSEYTLIFTRSGWVLITQNKVPRFSGNIRNRSELHFILKALAII